VPGTQLLVRDDEPMNDEVAVRRLIDHYADACDRDDADRVGQLFEDDGVLVVRGHDYRGAEILEFYRARLDVASLHFTTGVYLTALPDGLVGSTCGFAAIEMPDTGWSLITGRYDDVVRVDGDVARFVERRISVRGRRSIADG
jgi:hypothetical protein